MATTTRGGRIRARRKKLNLTQRQLAERTKVDVVTVWRLENDRIDNPTSDTLVGLASVLDVSLDWLTSGAKRRS